MKNVLELSNIQARNFFLKEESYFNFDLPFYYDFRPLIKKVSKKLKGSKLSDYYDTYTDKSGKQKSKNPRNFEDVNFKILNNKDGKYAWRPFQLIHPAIYVALCNEITDKENWNYILSKFSDFQNIPNIKCFSLPILSTEAKISDKAATVTNWWESIEQRSIELALEYEYLLHTDITDCYGSIYTHSIAWALHSKKDAKEQKSDNSLIGNKIDWFLQDMSYGQTNGIPQGSVLMDFIAEIVLGFADLQLSKRLTELKTKDYQIIRFRDDYRIFTNNPQLGELILKHLTEVLIELNLELKSDKTIASANVIRDSIKPDKLFWNLMKKGAKNLRDHLLIIHELADQHPNSGSLIKSLDKYFNRINSLDETHQNIDVLISILVDIAFKNPRTYPLTAAILSELLLFIDSEKSRIELLAKIRSKFNQLPNTGHLQVWLQRVTIYYDREFEYSENLCKKVNDSSINIWNSDWLKEDFRKIINHESLINDKAIDNISDSIEPEEVQLFETKSIYY